VTLNDVALAGITLDTLEADSNVIITAGGDTAITNDAALNLEGTVTGTLDATATTGGITDSGALSVTGDVTLNDVALAGITLDTLEADSNVIITAGGDTAITNDAALNLEGTVTGSLDATATTGGITDSNTLIVTVSADFNAQAGIVLSDLQATDIAADTASGAIDITNDSAAATTVTSLTTTGADISFTQTGAGVPTFTTVTTDGVGTISLTADAGLSVDGAVSTAGGDITINADSDGIATGSGLFTLAATGSIDTAGGNLTVTGADFDFLAGSSMTVGAGVFDLIFSRPGSLCLGNAAGCQINLDNTDLQVLTNTTDDLELDNSGNAILADAADFYTDDVTLIGSTIDNAPGVTTIGLTNIGALTLTASGNIGGNDALGVSATTVDVTDALDVTLFDDGAGDTGYTIGSNLNPVGAVSITESTSDLTISSIDANSTVILDAQVASLNINGAIDAGGTVQLNGTTAINLGADVNTTAGNIEFNDAVTVTADSQVDTSAGGGNIIFTGLIDGQAINAQSLTLTAGGGNVDLQAAVGGTTALANFEIVSAATADLDSVTAADINVVADQINLNGADYIAQNGNALFDGPVDLTTNVSVDSSTADGDITFTDTVDGAFDLTLTAGAGAIDLQAAAGATAALANFAVISAATADLDSVTAADINVVADQINLNGADYIAENGNALFDGPVDLTTNVSVDSSTADGDITFTDTVDGAFDLTLTAGAGAIDLQAAAGATAALANFEIVSAATADLDSVTAADINVVADQINLNGADYIAENGNALFDGPVDLTTNVSVDSSTADGDITFTDTVDGAFDLTLTAGAGAIDLQAAAGATAALANFAVISAATADLDSVTAADINVVADQINLNGADYIAENGNALFDGPVDLTTNVSVDSSTADGDITFTDTVDGAFDLTLTAGAGAIDLQAAAGATAALANFEIVSAATADLDSVTAADINVVADQINLNGADYIAENGNALFDGPVDLTTNVSVDSSTADGDITFTDTVDGAFDLTLTAGAGAIDLQAAAGATAALANFAVISAATADLDSVTAADINVVADQINLNGADYIAQNGNALFDGPVDLTTNVSVDSSTADGDITFTDTVDGAFDLTLTAGAGNIDLQSDVGALTPLSALTINSAADVDVVAVTAGTITQSAGTGTTTVDGVMTANTGDISITTNSIVQNADMTATGNVLLDAAADIELNEGVLTANDRLIHLIAGAGVQQNFDTLPTHGGLVATELLLEGTGDFNLITEGVNQVDTVAGNVNGTVAFINSQALTIGSVTDLLANTTDGLTAETLVVLAETGDLTVSEAATATTGNLGLFTDDGGILIDAAVVGAGLIDIEQVGAVGDIDFTVNGSAAADGDISLITENNIVMADGATATAVGNGRVEAGGDITLGGISADSLRIQAGGAIIDGGDADIDASATNLQLVAGNDIGTGLDAVEIDAGTLALSSTTGSAYLSADNGVIIGDIATFDVPYIDAPDGSTVLDPVAALTGATAAVGLFIEADGVIQVDEAVTATAGDLLLDAAGDLTINNGVTATAGNASLIAGGAITQAAAGDVSVAGNLDVEAGGVITMNADASSTSTGSGNIRYLSTVGDITLGLLDAGTGNVRVEAQDGSIVDGRTALTNVIAANLQLLASANVGAPGADALDVDVDTLAAVATTGNIYISEADGLNLTTVADFDVTRIGLDSTALPTAVGALSNVLAGNHVKIETVANGLTVTDTVTATGGDLLLDAAGDLTINNGVTATAGNASLIAGGLITQSATGDVIVAGNLDVEAGGAITMNADASSTSTGSGNIRYLSTVGDITLGLLDAGTGNVRVEAQDGSIVDGRTALTNVIAANLQLLASANVGA
ncbi:hypothetical protein, partial [Alcanivorax sp. 1008]|uniref:beta strand repeat-containing protein n=1 Tax=Alcanivorax sp. 1008 TaxID=2816853 RepID=UPI001D79317C